MVTYGDLFAFVIMLCGVITLVIYISRKKQRPLSGKLGATFCSICLPAARCTLVTGSLVKHIIQIHFKTFNHEIAKQDGCFLYYIDKK